MTTFDRYLTLFFLKIFAICFLSFAGLYIVIHLFSNFDEIMSLGKREGGQIRFMQIFYGPRLLDLFDRMGPILALVAAIFAFSMMQRRREMSAIEAAGIPKSRMVLPLVISCLVLIVLGTVSRELWLPKFRKELSLTPQTWLDEDGQNSAFQKDHLNGLLIRIRKTENEEHEYKNITVQIPIYLSDRVSRIVASRGDFIEATEHHPAGLLLEGIAEPVQAWKLDSLGSRDQPVVYFAKGHPWLVGNQVFISTNLTREELAYGLQVTDYSSLSEMIASLQRPTQWFSRTNRIAVHSRIVRPILDIALILVAFPIVVRFTEDNLLVAAVNCVATICVFQVSVMAFQTLGALSLVRAASLAAWLPVICFVPLCAVTWKMLDR